MAQKQPTSTSARSLAPNVAQGTLVVLAAVQVGLVANAVWKNDADHARDAASQLAAATNSRRLAVVPKVPAPKPVPAASKAPALAVSAAPAPAPTPTPSAPAMPPPASALPPRDPAALLKMSGLDGGLTPPPPAPVPAPAPTPAVAASSPPRHPALPAGKELSDPKVAQMVDAAREVRRSGDIQAAIESLKAADILKPNHPEILSELALTYEALGLSDKSQAAWSRVRAMGEKDAGGYYRLAAAKLEGVEPTDPVTPAGAISLGECSISKQGSKTILHVPMIVAPGQSLNAEAMDIQVFFFETGEGGRVDRAPPERSGAPSWAGSDPKWEAGKPEVLEIDYTPPAPATAGGKHEYHGYMVKLYYKDKLMGEQAEPPALLKFRPQQAGSAGADNALLPPIK